MPETQHLKRQEVWGRLESAAGFSQASAGVCGRNGAPLL
jgi:hypothetical protein